MTTEWYSMVATCLLWQEGTLLGNCKVGELAQLERPSGDLTSEASLETFLRFSLAELVSVGSGFVEILFIVRMRIRVTVCTRKRTYSTKVCLCAPSHLKNPEGFVWNSNKAWYVSMFMCGETGPHNQTEKWHKCPHVLKLASTFFRCSPNGVINVDTAVYACFDVIHILRTLNFLELLSGSQAQTGCDFVWLWSSSHIQHSDTLRLILWKCFKYNLKPY